MPRGTGALNRLRRSPVRSGLMGVAIAGVAVPTAMQRYRTVVRNDPGHEQTLLLGERRALDDAAVAAAWRAAEAGRDPANEAQRARGIEENLTRYRDFDISRELAEEIYDRAVEADVDPDLAFGLVHAESSFRNSATSSVGAIGLTQLMPKTAKWLEPGVQTADLRKPDTNLRIGLKYLRQLIDRYEGDTKLALLAYNRGPGTVDRVLERGGNPDNGYHDMVNRRRG